jgi:hypothetical protein
MRARDDRDGAGRAVQEALTGAAGHDTAEAAGVAGAEYDETRVRCLGALVQELGGGLAAAGGHGLQVRALGVGEGAGEGDRFAGRRRGVDADEDRRHPCS